MPAPPEDRIADVARLAEETAREVLSDEYAVLARRAATRLAEIAPDRLASGRPKSWACGILYALGRVNFLSDRSSGDVHMTLAELCTACGVSEATGTSKAREVLDLLDAGHFDPQWTLPSLAGASPVLWMLTAGPVMLDARTLGGDSQDLLARAGLIPYGPTVREPEPLAHGASVLLERDHAAPGGFRVTLDIPKPRPVPTNATHRAAQRGDIATLRIEIAGTDPLVWRRLDVPLSLPLADLHGVLQRAFGWQNCHLYAFQTKTQVYASFEPDADDLPIEGHVLADLVGRKGSRFVYLYDFGAGWEHEARLETTGPPEPGVAYPRCTDGERAGPPEDCGGPYGYADLCAVLADPTHPDHREMRAWAGKRFDPARFDLATTDRALRR